MEVAGFHRPKKQALGDLYNTCVKWHTQIGTDSSINGRNGVEIRTSPAGGATFLRQLYEVTKAINKANGFVNSSCGLHVHVGLEGYEKTSATIGSACRLWEVVEDTVYKLVNKSRQDNRYCRKIATSQTYALYRATTQTDDLYNLFNRVNGRYVGFNTSAVGNHGTIEFRLYHGCVKYQELMPWTLLCANIVHMGLTSKYPDDFAEWVKDMGAARFLYASAPNEAVKQFLRERLPKEDLDLTPIRKALGLTKYPRRAA